MYSYRVLFVYFLTIICVSTEEDSSLPMTKEERISLREEARKMFYHAYDAYMDNAFPADELMPLSCRGRWRGVTPSRGDLDDVLGNYSLTLIDSLDTLVILGDFNEFNRAIQLVIEHVRFDTDVVVSVFESNIRVLGGLLSAHVLATELREFVPILKWYSQELLVMADDLGTRLLPAFNTSTGLPFGRVNLLRGMEGIVNNRETCTACAGTILLEFAALSRLTGKPIYEQKASRAMDRLWKIRHRTSELMGTTIDVQSGDWVRKDSGVGAGIDSYYEYCLKAYILLGENKYLTRFNRHYNAIKKYISRGPLMLAVYMHRPHLQSRNFMDALLAFWPGLQVMMGDLRPAVETHEMLYQVMLRHTFIPEAFTADFQVHWAQHPLRPEFLESTYFLHRATGDDYYLRVGRDLLKALQLYARVACGYAAVNDVRTRVHEDRMDSFVLAETLKYLFMLFSDDRDLPVNIHRFIMTTEAHFLPLSLGQNNSNSSVRLVLVADDEDDTTRRTCPSTSSMVPKKVREPMRQMVGSAAARPLPRLRPLNDPRQLLALAEMGISVLTLDDGRVQLLYTTSTAKSSNDAAEGLTFMNEITKWNNLGDAENGVQILGVMFLNMLVMAGPAHFGKEISGDMIYEGLVGFVNPDDACSDIINKLEVAGKIGIAFRGQCTFSQKVWHMQLAGVKLAIIIDNTANTSAETSAVFAMSNDGKEDVDVVIPSAFLYSKEGQALIDAMKQDPNLKVALAERSRLQKMLRCPDEHCDDNNQMANAERRSFDHLKTVLSQLVAQFELTMNVDETPKRSQFIGMNPEIVYTKDKFINEDSRADILGESFGSRFPRHVKNKNDNSEENAALKKTVSSTQSNNINDEQSDKKPLDGVIGAIEHTNAGGQNVAHGIDIQCDETFNANNYVFDDKSNEENAGAHKEFNDVFTEKMDIEEYKNDRFNVEISQVKGIVEFTIEPEASVNSKAVDRHTKRGRKYGVRNVGFTPNFPFPPRNLVRPLCEAQTGRVVLKIGTRMIPAQHRMPCPQNVMLGNSFSLSPNTEVGSFDETPQPSSKNDNAAGGCGAASSIDKAALHQQSEDQAAESQLAGNQSPEENATNK